jgi:glycine hydroxymethyltransferase
VIRNAQAMASTLVDAGFKVVSGGTDNHLFLLDVRPAGLTGKVAEKVLQKADITTNKNMIPGDPESPFVTSGLRLGSPAMTTRGFVEKDFVQIGNWIAQVLRAPEDEELAQRVCGEVNALCRLHPLPY